jgi:hypothetical protein
MAEKKYARLIKSLQVQKPPAGLYPEPWIWMEGKDMEGFTRFSLGARRGITNLIQGCN